MRDIWSDKRKFEIWLEIETLACEAMAKSGTDPERGRGGHPGAGAFFRHEIPEIEKRTNHDVIAFLENVAASVGPAARWMHQGLTSSDVLDTTLAVQMTESARILADDLDALRDVIAEQAREFKMTPMIGRSHGIHAEPITFGLKLALMFDEFGRAEERLGADHRADPGRKIERCGRDARASRSGIERSVCERLGLKPAALSTQIIQRDRHAEFLTVLAIIASSIDRWATEFRHLQRTEVLEVEEFFGEGQKGSSAMPHKRNPITGERLCGLARVIRGNAVTAMENVALWHERDISHSSAERIILPDSCTLLDYMLVKLRELVDGLQIYPEHMEQNLGLTKGLYFSQSILLALTRAGAERKTAYEAVQRAAMRTWQGDGSFAENAKEEPEITIDFTGRNRPTLLAGDPFPACRCDVPDARPGIVISRAERKLAEALRGIELDGSRFAKKAGLFLTDRLGAEGNAHGVRLTLEDELRDLKIGREFDADQFEMGQQMHHHRRGLRRRELNAGGRIVRHDIERADLHRGMRFETLKRLQRRDQTDGGNPVAGVEFHPAQLESRFHGKAAQRRRHDMQGDGEGGRFCANQAHAQRRR